MQSIIYQWEIDDISNVYPCQIKEGWSLTDHLLHHGKMHICPVEVLSLSAWKVGGLIGE